MAVAVRTSLLNDATRMKRRYAAERRFRFYGIAAISVGVFFLAVLFTSIISKGWSAFFRTEIKLNVFLDPAVITPSGTLTSSELRNANYVKLARNALYKVLGVDASNRKERREANKLLSRGVDSQLRDMVLADHSVIGATRSIWLVAHGNVDALNKGWIDRKVPEARRQLSNRQVAWLDALAAKGDLKMQFNWHFLFGPPSSQPETAGLGVALLGSMFMMLTVMVLAVPLGVAAAIYLEKFARRTRLNDLIEVNINNLAAVPSIVFGLLGLAVFINFAGLPRSASIVGGLVLTLMTLPTIIIAARASITSIPPSISEAALGIGASRMQTVFHHVLPLAMPGILTGTIIGLVQALGETAPLLMIGMVAFIIDYPFTPLDPATALPVQIYMWATEAERGFVEKTAGGTIVLLLFLVAMNGLAIFLRNRYEKRW